MRRLLALSLLLAAPVAAQSSALQYGRAQPITAQERQQGAQANQGLIQEYGGALTGRQAAYVERIGQRIATQSGLSSTPGAFNVTLLNSPVNNAFAIPGGYVYVTRDLVALMNDEAELAAVMGHEVAHVAARHSRSRESAARNYQLGGLLGQTILGGILGNGGGLLGTVLNRAAQAAPQLLTLRFSRSQETQSDDLAIRYLASAGYDPLALSTMLDSLAEQTRLQGALRGEARSVPGWASTHPDPASRIRRAQQQAAQVRVATPTRNRDAFLAAIDGMLYGEDPAQGVIEGNSFLHPGLGVAFTVPQGFTMQNGTDAVTIQGSGAQAQFAAAPLAGSLDAYLATVVRGLGGTTAAPAERTTVNGIPAAYTRLQARSGNTPVDVTVFAYQLAPSRAVHFVTLAPAGRGPGTLEQVFGSLRRLSSSESAAIRPRYLRVVTVRAGETPASLAARMAYPDFRLERFLVLNRLEPNVALRPGDKVKLVTY